ncbi:hypothetical protein [Nitrobacter sp. TKz-YC02]|uniref:hypothetical protein n=1 Tax=Nitrobacter sp. TKz-YC02 TaxID=3398704 RepID=UPI003CF8DE35
MNTVTVRAACLRFARSHGHDRRIARLTPHESANFHGANFAIVERNIIRDTGDIEAVERWCRDAGVLAATERLAT